MFETPLLLLFAQTFLQVCALVNPLVANYIKKVTGDHLHFKHSRILVNESKDLAFLVAVCGGRRSRSRITL